MTPGREYAWVLAGLALGGAGVLGASAPRWVTASTDDPSLGALARSVELSGTALEPVLSPLALVALAGVVGVVASRTLARRLVGALLLSAGGALVWAVLAARFGSVTVTRAARATAGLGSLDVLPQSWSPAWLPALAGGVLICASAALVMTRAARWPTLSSRYERGAAAGRQGGTPKSDAWSRLDRGEDPTADDLHPRSSDRDLTQ